MLDYNLLIAKITQYQSEETDARTKKRLEDQIVAANEGLCVRKISKYRDSSVEWDDLLNAARLGIYEAARRFDLSKKVRFSTFACHWINKYVQLQLEDSNSIHIPRSAKRVNRQASDLARQGVFGIKELSQRIGKSEKYVFDCISMTRPVRQMPLDADGKELEFASWHSSPQEPSDYNPRQLQALEAFDSLDPIAKDIVSKIHDGCNYAKLGKIYSQPWRVIKSLYTESLRRIRELLNIKCNHNSVKSPSWYSETLSQIKEFLDPKSQPKKERSSSWRAESLGRIKVFLGLEQEQLSLDLFSVRSIPDTLLDNPFQLSLEFPAQKNDANQRRTLQSRFSAQKICNHSILRLHRLSRINPQGRLGPGKRSIKLTRSSLSSPFSHGSSFTRVLQRLSSLFREKPMRTLSSPLPSQ